MPQEIVTGDTRHVLHCGDCLEIMKAMPSDSVDLVFTSPPYVDCRTYGINFDLTGQEYVDWAKVRFLECIRICKGMVCWVIEGKTKDYRYDCTPFLLAADLHRAGVHLRKPPVYHRVGIPGSGGPDWWRNDWEPIICGSKGGKLPWSDNTAVGEPPKYAPGGAMSHRTVDGSRVNRWGDGGMMPSGYEDGDVRRVPAPVVSPSHYTTNRKGGDKRQVAGGRRPAVIGGRLSKAGREGNEDKGRSGEILEDGSILRKDGTIYDGVDIANPGNIIKCVVGGGAMGSDLAHESEAPFPEKLVEAFVRSFCPPNGTCLDCFCGSGTSLRVASVWGRNSIGIDIRQSQIDLSIRRLKEPINKPSTKPLKIAEGQKSIFDE